MNPNMGKPKYKFGLHRKVALALSTKTANKHLCVMCDLLFFPQYVNLYQLPTECKVSRTPATSKEELFA